jgi:hypothetical protein
MKIDVSVPDRPDNPGHLIRQRDGGFVVAQSRRRGHGPLLQPRQTLRRRSRRALGGQQDGAGPVRE